MSRQTPLDRDAFAAHIEAVTRQAGYVVEQRQGMTLTLNLHGQSMPCDLKMLYSAYQRSPDRLDDIVSAHLSALGQVPAPPVPPTEKDVAESFLPLLNPANWLDVVARQGAVPPVYRPYVAGLIITYVFDFPHARAYVNQETFSQLLNSPEATPDTVHEYALENLRKRTSKRDTSTYGMGDQTVVVCESKDGFAATRVLLPELMATWAERVPGRMLLGAPNRDFLIAFSDRDPAQVAAITQQIRRDAAQREGKLTAELLMWRNGKVVPHRTVH